MLVVKTKTEENGSHANQTWPDGVAIPDGYAVVPDDLTCENFPFGEIAVDEIGGVLTVVGWKPLPIPEIPEPEPQAPPDDKDAKIAALEREIFKLKGGF